MPSSNLSRARTDELPILLSIVMTASKSSGFNRSAMVRASVRMKPNRVERLETVLLLTRQVRSPDADAPQAGESE
jgi:hypothetical protein